MRRLAILFALAVLILTAAPVPSFAQQAVGVTIGGFYPVGLNSRDPADVLFDDSTYLAFDVKDFHSLQFGGEYLVGLGRFLEGQLGVGYYSDTVPSVYLDYINDNGSEIEQRLHLQMVPFTASVRLLPLGRNNGFEPYIGGGVAITNWKYREYGEFVDFTDSSIFPGDYNASGTATGPLFVGGARIPLGAWAVGGEIRYQHLKGDLPADQFLVPKIDLSGWTYAGTFSVRF